ncbi:MAG: Ig-like domain-containing protein [bacterium]
MIGAPAHRSTRRGTALAAVALALIVAAACGGDDAQPQGLRLTPAGSGPRVVWDPQHRPTSDVPFPNDLVTVLDPSAPTGRRLNVRDWAPTSLERRIRGKVDRLDGFGTFAPITVAFDAPIDLATANSDTIRVVDIQPGSARAGEAAPLDIGGGSFPIEITPWAFPPYDPARDARQLLFDPRFGDIHDPGFADHYERQTNTLVIRPLVPLDPASEYAVVLTDGLRDASGQAVRSPFPYVNHTFQTESLTRALPLLAQAGVERQHIAFAWTFTTQSVTRETEALAAGIRGEGSLGWLATRYPAEILTVDSMETQLDALFCGGPGYETNPCVDNVHILQAEMLDTFLEPLLGTPEGGALVASFAKLALGVDLGEDVRMMMRVDAIDYFVFGRFRSPDFRGTSDQLIHVDTAAGTAEVREGSVPFLIAIPKPSAGHHQPFPVIVHAHGLPSFRWEVITLANEWAKHGYASVCMDAVNHSPVISIRDVQILLGSVVGGVEDGLCSVLPKPLCATLVPSVLDGLGEPIVKLIGCVLFGRCGDEAGGLDFQSALTELLSTGLFRELLVEGRAIDADGDGNTDHGYFFTLDLFESRDRVRQTLVDHLQLMRLLRGLDQAKVPPALPDPARASSEALRPHLLSGDFDGDGVLDLGGASAYARNDDGSLGEPSGPQRFFRTGFSLGGILTSTLMALEPETTTGAVVVPGGGMASDILLRLDLRPVSDPVFHELLGPVVVAEPSGGDPERYALSFLVRKKLDRVRFGIDPSMIDNTFRVPVGELVIPAGGSLRLANGANGEEASVAITSDEPASLAIAADRGDAVTFEARAADGAVVGTLSAPAPATGLGLTRNSPDFRRLVTLGQIALEPADPINYAPHWFREPLAGVPAKNILMLSVPGDTFVPINTQVAVARAAGLFGSVDDRCDGSPRTLEECGADLTSDCDCVNLTLAAKEVMLGFDEPPEHPRYDIDGREHCGGLGPLAAHHGASGYSAVRYPFASQPVREADGSLVNKGEHWFMAFSDWTIPVNWGIYAQNQIAAFFDHDGGEPPVDCACPATNHSCELTPDAPPDAAP